MPKNVKNEDVKNEGVCKCVKYDTIIPLYNGQLKRADEIKLSDKLIGDDGEPCDIKKIIKNKNKGSMYNVRQANGETYTVDSQHILTLHMPDHKVIFWNNSKNGWSVLWWNHEKQCTNSKFIPIAPVSIKCPECEIQLSGNLGRHYKRMHKDLEVPKMPRKPPTVDAPDTQEVKDAKIKMEEFCETITDNNIFDISIENYMKLNSTTKLRLAGICGKCIEWKKKKVDLDPYVLGLWLGDGMQAGYSYACYGEKDPQIIKYLENWGKENDANLKKTSKYTYGFSSRENYRKKGFAPLKKQLEKYDLVNNKHIPMDYIVNDRETRLKVLAGMIDTDGHVARDGTRIIISQGLMHEQLINDFTFLARSLGFYVSFRIRDTTWTWKGEHKTGECYNLNISGNIEDIPTLLPRKKCANIKKHSELTTGFITVRKTRDEKYVGFEIDENQRFLVNDFTVTHC